MDVFAKCSEINELLESSRDADARDSLFKLLDYHAKNALQYTPLINHLIRETGLYPYLHPKTSTWADRFAYEAFKVDTGDAEQRTLHREQSALLKMLVEGESIAVSAPTSFGKTFVIDAFISLSKPDNVMIIVPTIALMDEVRRRIYRKFGSLYKIITTTDVPLGERNLFVFPQERAVGYVDQLKNLDLLVVDEFYKASSDFDRERSPALLKAILKLGKLAKQRYFLAPNISGLSDNVITRGMTFVNKLDFSTVYLQQHHLYKTIKGNEVMKGRELLKILRSNSSKSLIYAASYTEIEKVVSLLIAETDAIQRPLLSSFSSWLGENYGPHWKLTKLVARGAGIHNGQIHRSLSQIQLKLFESERGLDTIVSTSSIIEGVNTSAESVILWKNRKGGRGNPYLDTFTYKNIIGRSGRMFKYFVGQVYLLEKPPEETSTELEIEFPDSILGGIDEKEHKESLSNEQVTKIITFREKMTKLLGEEAYTRLYKGAGAFQVSDSDLILNIAEDMVSQPTKWNGFSYLNSSNPIQWERILYLLLGLQPGTWDIEYRKFVFFVKILSRNWELDLPKLLRLLEPIDVGVDVFFKLERNVSFKLSSLLHDVNELQKEISGGRVDVSPFVSRLSHAFLPSVVYQLEEYGLPRIISRKIHRAGLINFESDSTGIHSMLDALRNLGRRRILLLQTLNDFDRYIVDYFFEGIESPSNA